jgi:hypothetical protein
MNIAKIMAGPYRGNPTLLESELANIGYYPTYVSCLDHYQDTWLTNRKDLKGLFTTPYIDFNNTLWSKNRNDEAGLSGFLQFWNLKHVIDNTPDTYDYYIKTRSDLHFHTKLDIDFSTLKEDTLYSSAKSFHRDYWDINTWLNDEFYIGSRKVMEVVASFVTEYYKNNTQPLNYREGSNESTLRNHLIQNNIRIGKIEGLSYSKNNNGDSNPTGWSGNYNLEMSR